MQKISIIVPVYNTEKYLSKCIESLIGQTYNNLEIIIINDGSTDNSENIVKNYLERDYRIKYFKKENGGLSDARNYGVLKATGDYICFVDSDDYIDRELFEKLSKYFNQEYDLIKYKAIKVDEEGKEIEKINGPIFTNKNGQEAFEILRLDDVYLEAAWLYLFKTQFYKDNKFEFLENTYHEDFGLIPLILLKANKVASTNIYGYYYVQSEESITRNTPYEQTVKRANDIFVHYGNMLKYVEKNSVTKMTKDNIKMFYTNSILLKVEELKDKEQKEYINKIKKDKLIKNIKVRNLKQLIKKILLYINIKLYIKMR